MMLGVSQKARLINFSMMFSRLCCSVGDLDFNDTIVQLENAGLKRTQFAPTSRCARLAKATPFFLSSRSEVPLSGFPMVRRQPLPKTVQLPEIVLCTRIPLVSGLQKSRPTRVCRREGIRQLR
jgi:hypothetical protein